MESTNADITTSLDLIKEHRTCSSKNDAAHTVAIKNLAKSMHTYIKTHGFRSKVVDSTLQSNIQTLQNLPH